MTELEASRSMWQSLAVGFLVVIAISLSLVYLLGIERDAAHQKLDNACSKLSGGPGGMLSRVDTGLVYCYDVQGNIDYEASLIFREYEEKEDEG